MRGTYTFNGYHLRLDQIKSIEPLYSSTENLNGIYSIFIKSHKLHMRSQYSFAVWFINKGGYKSFYSKTVDYTGVENFKGDQGFKDEYEGLVFAWKEYHEHDKQRQEIRREL